MIKKDSTLNELVTHIIRIYEESNSERDFKAVALMFFEDIGRCFQLIIRKRENEVEDMLPSIFKWFCILYSKCSVDKKNLVSEILWFKFPKICPYCKASTCTCKVGKESLDIEYITKFSQDNIKKMPTTLNDWQNHFQQIYPKSADSGNWSSNVSHLAEELAELNEAYRKSYVKKGIPCVEMELADVFTWIIGLANVVDAYKDALPKNEKGRYQLGDAIFKQFEKGCPKCIEQRDNLKLGKCCCSILEKKLRLISDYDDEDVNQYVTEQQSPYKP